MLQLIAITPCAERVIEHAARISHDSLDKLGGAPNFVTALCKMGHLNPLAHACATFHITHVSRSLSHQLVRHWTANPTQRSQRYVNEKRFKYVTPTTVLQLGEATRIFYDAMQYAAGAYEALAELGIPKEDARYVLPNACETELDFTVNFRTALTFFKARLDRHAQWEIQDLARDMYTYLHRESPRVFNPETIEACPKVDINWDWLEEV